MNRAKKIALDALKCPVRRAVNDAFNRARPAAYQDLGHGHVVFTPSMGVDKLRQELDKLVRDKILKSWTLDVETEYPTKCHVDVKFTYAQGHGVLSFRVW